MNEGDLVTLISRAQDKKISWVEAPFVQKVDNSIYWLNLYPLKSTIGFPNTYNTYLVDSAIQRLNNQGQDQIRQFNLHEYLSLRVWSSFLVAQWVKRPSGFWEVFRWFSNRTGTSVDEGARKLNN